MKTMLTVLGTRPEIIKLSPLLPLLSSRWRHVLVHTGQHYDHALDGIFFEELRLRPPDVRLDVGSGSHGEQTARMLLALEPILIRLRPDAVLVQGDTNTTLAGALAASKLGIPLIHLEAGCRSFNRRMPEEINRVLVDHCAELLLAADETAQQHLLAEGLSRSRIALVGSTALDACLRSVRFANNSAVLQQLQLTSRSYLLATIHRAENTAPEVLPGLIATLNQLARERALVVPLHPRTAAAMNAQGLSFAPQVRVCPPLGYLDMLQLLRHAQAVLTDSGGLQEEAGALNVPLLILRHETEWSYLVQSGKALLVGNQPASIMAHVAELDDTGLLRMRARAQAPATGAAQRSITAIAKWFAAQEERYARADAQPVRVAAVGA